MSPKQYLLLAALTAWTPACFTPNVICNTKTFELKRTIRHTTPHDQDLNELDIEPFCVDAGGDLLELEGFVSAMDYENIGSVQVADQHELQRFEQMMDAIQNGTASEMSEAHLETYTEKIGAMIAGLQASCVERLTHPGIGCAPLSAIQTCNNFVVYPTWAQYLDFDAGPDYQRPHSYNSDIHWKGGGGWCYDYYDWDSGTDTEGSSSTSTGGDDTTSGGDSGGDETYTLDGSSGEEDEAPPFGDLDELVHCNSAKTFCTYDPVLIDNVFGALDQVAADGAILRMLDPKSLDAPGIVLEGFDRGEASTELAGAAGLQDGDIIKTINGLSPSSEEVVFDIAQKLAKVPEATIVYQRGHRTRKVRIEPK